MKEKKTSFMIFPVLRYVSMERQRTSKIGEGLTDVMNTFVILSSFRLNGQNPPLPYYLVLMSQSPAIPLRLSSFTRYWSITQSSADRFPSRSSNASARIPPQRQETVLRSCVLSFDNRILSTRPIQRLDRRLHRLQRLLRLLLIAHVDLRQPRPRFGELLHYTP